MDTKYLRRNLRSSLIIPVALLLLAVGSVAVVLVNRGVNYADYNITSVIQFNKNLVKPEQLDRFANMQYVTRIDKEGLEVAFQQMPTEQFNKLVADLQSDTKIQDVTAYSYTQTMPSDLAGRFVWGSIMAVGLTLVLGYFLVLRKLNAIKPNSGWVNLAKYSLAIALALLVQLGFLSLLSNIYSLGQLTLSSLTLTYVWAVSLLMWVFMEVGDERERELSEPGLLLANNRKRVLEIGRIGLLLSGIVLVVVALGLGKRFVVDGIMIWVGMAIATLAIAYLPAVWVRLSPQALAKRISRIMARSAKPKQGEFKSNSQADAKLSDHKSSHLKQAVSLKKKRRH